MWHQILRHILGNVHYTTASAIVVQKGMLLNYFLSKSEACVSANTLFEIELVASEKICQ